MPEQTAKNTQARRICYVDDSRTSAFVTKRMLEKQGYVVDHFAGADLALEAVLEKEYDLLITDLMITTEGDGVNGDDLIRLIRLSGHPQKSRLPIIVVTGAADEKTMAQLVETGANRVLPKPLDEGVLDESIQAVFRDEQTAKPAAAIEKPSVLKKSDNKSGLNSLKDQLTTQLEKQQDAMIPTLTEEVSVEEQKKSASTEKSEEGINPALSQKFETREIRPVTSMVDIPLVEDLPTDNITAPVEQKKPDKLEYSAKTTSDPKSSQETHEHEDLVASANSIIDQYKVDDLSLKPKEDDGELVFPPSRDEIGSPTAKKAQTIEKVSSSNSSREARNPFMDEIEALFRDEKEIKKNGDAKIDKQSSPSQGENKKLEDKKQQSLSGELKSPRSENYEEDVLASEPEWLKKGDEKEKRDNPLLDLLDSFDSDSLSGDKKTAAFKKPNLNLKLNMSTRTRNIVLGVLAALLLIPPLFYTILQETLSEVDFVAVEVQPIHESVIVSGRVVSRKKVNVTSFFPGQIADVKVKEGQFVKKGTTLAVLDGREARSKVNKSEAKLISIREKVALARKTLQRLQRALEKGAVSRQMVEDAETAWKTESARQSLVEEELKEAKLQVERLTIVAPFDGMVATLEAQEGQWLAPPEPLLKLVDVKNTEVELRVDAADSSNLLQGQKVEMSSDAHPGLTWMEVIKRVSTTTERENSGNFIHVYVSLSEKAPELKVGQQVDAAIRTSSNNRALVVPFEAIQQHNGQTMVAVSLNERVHFVPVVTGIQSFSHVEIVQGLTVNQRVLLPGGLQLEEGQKIQILEP